MCTVTWIATPSSAAGPYPHLDNPPPPANPAATKLFVEGLPVAGVVVRLDRNVPLKHRKAESAKRLQEPPAALRLAVPLPLLQLRHLHQVPAAVS